MAEVPNQPVTKLRDDDIYHPNDIRLKEVVLKVGNDKIDVKRLLVQINLFEDLYSNALTGSVTFADAINLIGNAPLVGQEELILTYRTPGFSGYKEVSLEFDIYQISERNTGSTADLTDTTQTYTLHFVSKSYYKNLQNKVRQAFRNQRIDEMVTTIGKQIGVDIKVEPTSGSHSFVIPGWTPFYTINWLANRARPEGNPYAANFFFFETIDGFRFVSVNSLVQNPVQVIYHYDPANFRKGIASQASVAAGSSRLIIPELWGARSYAVMKSGDTLERIEQGMYASKLITHDLVKKQFRNFDFRYKEDFRRLQHTEDAVTDDKGIRTAQFPRPFSGSSRHSDKTESVVMFYPKHTEIFDGMKDYDESQKWVQQRTSQLRQLEQLRIRLELPGDSARRVGDVVVLDVPRPESPKGYDYPEDRDPNVSGSYLITSIHHVIELDNHRMVVELSKESLSPKSKASLTDLLDLASSTYNSAKKSLSDAFSSAKTLLKNIF